MVAGTRLVEDVLIQLLELRDVGDHVLKQVLGPLSPRWQALRDPEDVGGLVHEVVEVLVRTFVRDLGKSIGKKWVKKKPSMPFPEFFSDKTSAELRNDNVLLLFSRTDLAFSDENASSRSNSSSFGFGNSL